jgi:lipopolysaccharide export system protein LptA
MIRRMLPALVALLLVAAAADPVKITSDSFVVDDAKHVANFTGSVVITRTNLTVWANSVLVEYGEAGPSSVRSFTASGNVKVKTREQTATGDQATYDPKTQILRLTGHVMLTNGKGNIGSSDLVIDLKSNVSTFSSGKSGRVSGVFTTP